MLIYGTLSPYRGCTDVIYQAHKPDGRYGNNDVYRADRLSLIVYYVFIANHVGSTKTASLHFAESDGSNRVDIYDGENAMAVED